MRKEKLSVFVTASLLVFSVLFTAQLNAQGKERAKSTPTASYDITAVVKSANDKWDRAFNSGDVATVASLYEKNGRVVTGDGKIINGRANIKNLFKSVFDGGFHDHKIEMIDVQVNGDIAWETAKWTGVGADNKTYRGHIVNIFERQSNGDWKVRLHIWN